jgi:predicted RNA-binding protein (virulence factor B family)
LGNLVNRARTNNQFTGYLKLVEDKYFVKEAGSYLFFSLILSPWELPPDTNKLNEPVLFQLGNLDKPEKLNATLFNHRYIPQFTAAQKHFTNKTSLNATVYKITPHGIYVNVIGDKLQAKIPAKKEITDLKEGDKIKIIITYLSNTKIVVEQYHH